MKYCDASTLGVSDTTGLNSLVDREILPKGHCIEMWINGDSKIGTEIKKGLNMSSQPYGTLRCIRTLTGSNVICIFTSYTDLNIYVNNYAFTNDKGWDSTWKKVSLDKVQ